MKKAAWSDKDNPTCDDSIKKDKRVTIPLFHIHFVYVPFVLIYPSIYLRHRLIHFVIFTNHIPGSNERLASHVNENSHTFFGM